MATTVALGLLSRVMLMVPRIRILICWGAGVSGAILWLLHGGRHGDQGGGRGQ